jgi:hypothetical protein
MFSLDSCTEPDLDALNARVAEAVDVWDDDRCDGKKYTRLHEAVIARRAALAPKPRYEATDATRILDNQTGYLLTANCIAMLLNEKEAAK